MLYASASARFFASLLCERQRPLGEILRLFRLPAAMDVRLQAAYSRARSPSVP